MCRCTVCGADGTSGQGVRHPPIPPRGSLMCYSCLKVNHLEAQIADTKAFLDHLETHLELLKSNHTHDYFSRRFPPEITSHIFTFAISGESSLRDRYIRPLTLGAVSRRWRQIAWSTPSLWTYVPVDLNKFEESFQPAKEFLLQWLGRTGQLPLFIRICYDEWESDISRHVTNFTNVVEIINEYSSRWEYLNVGMPFSLFPRLRSACDEAPMLKFLTIEPPLSNSEGGATGHKGEVFDICTVPPLPQDVTVEDFPFTSIRIDWSNVTTLRFEGISVVDCLCLFQQAPSLSESSLYVINDDGILELDDQIILPCLTKLKIRPDDLDAANDFFDSITLPVLKSLEYYASDLRECFALADLLTRSSCPLTYLSINCPIEGTERDQGFVRILRAIPTLEDLHLDITSLPSDFFHSLSAPPSGEISDRPILLPKLTRLSYDGKLSFNWFSFIKCVESRRSIRGNDGRPLLSSIDLRFTAIAKDSKSPPYYINELATAHICRLVERGANIEVSNGASDMLQYSREYHEKIRFGE
ncbi:unnamed protein product [Cyclocybe aegerita]|uniref:F-box domain-containing protein n=1 Tax=Cyclocybe aegerita TaxID=1973307 RepID=A0A8S0X689_CYCAE|nr:unnamed protein product [Cyclocybe aegerita]